MNLWLILHSTQKWPDWYSDIIRSEMQVTARVTIFCPKLRLPDMPNGIIGADVQAVSTYFLALGGHRR